MLKGSIAFPAVSAKRMIIKMSIKLALLQKHEEMNTETSCEPSIGDHEQRNRHENFGLEVLI
jgi:hypothetical protein